jgi:ABC-type polysaccharide/polyol phosphate transport system ATPase subunit
MNRRPIVVEAHDVHKSFRMPTHRMDTLKERALHAFSTTEYKTFEALKGLSFEIAEGECFGIVGRNGSGKTTLLKLLASIYRLDRGRIRVAGTLAPFIELSVGFNPNLTARDNVLLNGVMMGSTPKEARRRFDEVIEFAELEDFVELPVRNYSSGMTVRLGFSLMVVAQADVMLIDEVLAVGDASFAQKCADVFDRMRHEGRTIVLVTHDMDSMQAMCDRAILIEDGVIELAGDPAAVGSRYMQINLAGPEGLPAVKVREAEDVRHAAKITRVWLEDSDGNRTRGIEQGAPIRLNVEIETAQALRHPVVAFEICAADGAQVFCAPAALAEDTGHLEAGERVHFKATVSNLLTPGTYFVNCSLSQRGLDEVDLRRPAAEFVIRGEHQFGYVELEWESEVERHKQAEALEAVDQ